MEFSSPSVIIIISVRYFVPSSVYLFLLPSFRPSLRPSICPSIRQLVHQLVRLSIHSFVRSSIRPLVRHRAELQAQAPVLSNWRSLRCNLCRQLRRKTRRHIDRRWGDINGEIMRYRKGPIICQQQSFPHIGQLNAEESISVERAPNNENDGCLIFLQANFQRIYLLRKLYYILDVQCAC